MCEEPQANLSRAQCNPSIPTRFMNTPEPQDKFPHVEKLAQQFPACEIAKIDSIVQRIRDKECPAQTQRTPEQINRINAKVAELCGWTEIFQAHGSQYGLNAALCKLNDKPMTFQWEVPSYYSDLNDCRDFEQPMEYETWLEYQDNLENVCGCDGWEIMSWNERKAITCATAPQRCEAFLTLNGVNIEEI